ncbi:MAG: tetratricopeptide repeat protein [Ktedonobacteraceae bacterium]
MAQTTLRDYLQSTEDAISSGRIDEAFDYCQIMITNFPESLEAQRLLGEVYLAQGQLADAQQTFDWVLTNDPENVIAYCDRALISERMADYETALDCYQQAYELSRGNSQIRQEFNILSAKVGQQGFIFSRAGLARLYMRGDLLPQAMQEWEIVLNSSPERLDARTGLLETYWREGLYDQVQQLARDILNDVPSCLKALLLLAHVTFVQNVSASQELLQRAEALDPELTMASDLFSDLLASKPHDPFLALLQKDISTSTQGPDSQPTVPSPVGITQAASSPAGPTASSNNGNGSHSTSEFSESLMRWSSLDNIIEPQQDYQVMQDASPLVTWSGTQQSASNAWNMLTEQETSSPLEAQQQTAPQEHNSTTFDNWSMPEQSSDNWPTLETQTAQSSANNDAIVADEHPSWFTSSQEEPKDEGFARWSNTPQVDASNVPTTRVETPAEEPLSSPPAWLDMLTKGEQTWRPDMPATDSATPVEPFSETLTANEQQNTTSIVPRPDDEPDYFFGPEWLKSLGAAAMDSTDSTDSIDAMDSALPAETTASVEPTPAIAGTVTPQFEPEPIEQKPGDPFEEVTPFDWTSAQPEWEEQMAQADVVQPTPEVVQPVLTAEPDNMPEPSVAQAPDVPEQKQQTSVEDWLALAAEKLSHPDQNTLTTLEELEKDLHSQGFTRLKPGALAAIAQEPTLSSALAQLGNYEEQASSPSQSTEQATFAQSAETPVAPATPTTPVEPLWAATPEPVAQQNTAVASDVPAIPTIQTANVPSAQETQPATAMPSHLDMLSSFAAQTQPKTPSSPLPKPERVAQPTAQVSPAVPHASSPPAAQGIPLEALLDMDLETTMKRPAVRLQPMQPQRQGTTRGNAGERPISGRPASGDLTYKERLLKGYQFQLAGSYDNAMQEYRIIIRNAPELLGEVVSNMRALLKLAPKYSAGYRVLGDAYMRQGEYLQAMEAYNKALTMAKKAKS